MGTPRSSIGGGTLEPGGHGATAAGDLKRSLLDKLPGDCWVRILSFLAPRDACNASCVCKAFRSAADADEPWYHRLPKSHGAFVSHTDGTSCKDLYRLLLRRSGGGGVLLRNGTLAYWVEPTAREGCFMLSARSLYIVWGDDEHYWSWVPLQNSWFLEGAYLNYVWWFEVHGEFKAVFQPGQYTVSFRLCMDRSSHGWEQAPVDFSLTTSNGHHDSSQRFLHDQAGTQAITSRVTPVRTFGQWKEFHAGEFSVESEMTVILKFHMMEINCGFCKRGILLEGVKIQPRETLEGCVA